jgi:hypothetical protein
MLTLAILFTSRYRHDEQLAMGLRSAMEARPLKIVDLHSSDVNDLLLVAKYRILQTPTVIFLSNTKVMGRILSKQPVAAIRELVREIENASN